MILLERDEAQDALKAAQRAAPEQRLSLTLLATQGVSLSEPAELYYESTYEIASDLRDLLETQCGFVEPLTGRATTLGLIYDELL